MAYGDTLTRGSVGRVVDYPWTVEDTMAYRDTLTQGSVGWVVVQGLSLDCPRYNVII